jgi:hypothetical protein
LGQEVLGLFTAIGSGNIESAQTAYDDVISLLLGGNGGVTPSAPATTTTSTTATSAATTATAPVTTPAVVSNPPTSPAVASILNSPTNNSFTSLLAQIGSALGSGNINSAQSALDNFLQGLTAGSIFGATA